MPDLDILGQMIKDSIKVSLTVNQGNTSVTLAEPQCPDYSVSIKGMPPDAIVIKVDAFRSDTIFNGRCGECKRADYVIITNSRGKKRILYIEMKRTKASPKEVIDQLTGAKCFMHYCQEIGRMFWGEKAFLKDYKHRFISIGHISISKKKTRITRDIKTHDTPEKMLKIDWPHYLQFKHLIGA